jgi:hypothetical protein
MLNRGRSAVRHIGLTAAPHASLMWTTRRGSVSLQHIDDIAVHRFDPIRRHCLDLSFQHRHYDGVNKGNRQHMSRRRRKLALHALLWSCSRGQAACPLEIWGCRWRRVLSDRNETVRNVDDVVVLGVSCLGPNIRPAPCSCQSCRLTRAMWSRSYSCLLQSLQSLIKTLGPAGNPLQLLLKIALLLLGTGVSFRWNEELRPGTCRIRVTFASLRYKTKQ